MEIQRIKPTEWERFKILRLAALADAPDAFDSTLEMAKAWPNENWQGQAANIPTFIASIDNTDIGIVRVATEAPNPSDAYLISMWVSPSARGRRVGEHLVTAAIDYARGAGYSQLLLDVADNNVSAIALYARLGFEPTGKTDTFSEPRAHIKEHQRVLRL
ncbi:MAG: GNAT family N-acetyltransferase [Pseudomonadota bacterium]